MKLQLCCLHFLETNCQIANTVTPSLIGHLKGHTVIMSPESKQNMSRIVCWLKACGNNVRVWGSNRVGCKMFSMK